MDFEFKQNYYIECPNELVDSVIRHVQESYETLHADNICVVSGDDETWNVDPIQHLSKETKKPTRVYIVTGLTRERAKSHLVRSGIVLGKHGNIAMVCVNGLALIDRHVVANIDHFLQAFVKECNECNECNAIIFRELSLSDIMSPCTTD